jgi:hypothetical protein
LTVARRLASVLVLVAGGLNNTNAPPKGNVATADLWDPNTGLFKSTGLLFYGRTSHAAVTLLSGEVLIVGGETESGPALYAELYDPSKGSFSVSGMESDERYRHTATLLPNGRVLVAGGIGNPTGVDLYDRSSGKFTSAGPLTVERQLHSATLLPNGSVLVAGGSDSDQSLVNSAELYF